MSTANKTINNNKPASSAFIRSAVFNWTYTTPLFIVHMTHWAAAAADAAFIYMYIYAPSARLMGGLMTPPPNRLRVELNLENKTKNAPLQFNVVFIII